MTSRVLNYVYCTVGLTPEKNGGGGSGVKMLKLTKCNL